MSNWARNHFNKMHKLDRVFQAEINLDIMHPDDVHDAILIRHGATHKLLVDKEGHEISSQQLKKLTTHIYRQTGGNIGEALHEWAGAIKLTDDDKVMFVQKQPHGLPEFLNSDIGILLALTMRERRTNEYRLRKMFGPPFKEKYKYLVQRLISTGLFQRKIDGWLEVNDLVVNDVGKQLEKEHYL